VATGGGSRRITTWTPNPLTESLFRIVIPTISPTLCHLIHRSMLREADVSLAFEPQVNFSYVDQVDIHQNAHLDLGVTAAQRGFEFFRI